MCTVQYRRVPWKTRVAEKIEKELSRIPETAIFQNVYVGGIAILERKTVGKEIDLKYSKLFRYEDLVPGIMTTGQFKRLKERGAIQAYTLPGPNTPGQYFINFRSKQILLLFNLRRKGQSSIIHYLKSRTLALTNPAKNHFAE